MHMYTDYTVYVVGDMYLLYLTSTSRCCVLAATLDCHAADTVHVRLPRHIDIGHSPTPAQYTNTGHDSLHRHSIKTQDMTTHTITDT